MISINDFDAFLSNMVDSIEGIDDYLISPIEKHTVKRLKDKTGVFLVAVVPSFDTDEPSPESVKYVANSFFFVVEKTDYTSATPDSEIAQYNRLQLLTQSVIDYMLSKRDSCEWLRSFKAGNLQIDPEYDIFGGWNGWSMAVSL